MSDCKNDSCTVGNIISGIKCDVAKCVYHREGDMCQAGCIEVGHTNSASSSETACVTFKNKAE